MSPNQRLRERDDKDMIDEGLPLPESSKYLNNLIAECGSDQEFDLRGLRGLHDGEKSIVAEEQKKLENKNFQLRMQLEKKNKIVADLTSALESLKETGRDSSFPPNLVPRTSSHRKLIISILDLSQNTGGSQQTGN